MNMRLLGALVLVLAVQAFAVTYNTTETGLYSSSGFRISELTQAPDRIYPGDEVLLRFMVETTEAAGAQDVELNVLAPFLSQKSAYFLGNLAQKEQKPISVNFVVPSTAKPGSYSVYVYATSKQGTQAQVGDIRLVINEPLLSNALIAKVNAPQNVYTGEELDLPVEIRNVGQVTAEGIIVQMQYTAGNTLIPIGSDRIYIDSIDANGSASANFRVGVSPAAAPGFYPVTLHITYKVDKVLQPAIDQTFGMMVGSKTSLLITADAPSTTSGTAAGNSLVITVANVGDTPVRGAYVSASSQDYGFSGASDKFIGTLNLDDSATMSLSLIPKAGARTAGRTVSIRVSYKDALNIEHTQQQEKAVGGTSGESAPSSGTVTNDMHGTNQRFGREAQQFTILGLQPLVLATLIVVLVGAYFGYKWYKRRRK